MDKQETQPKYRLVILRDESVDNTTEEVADWVTVLCWHRRYKLGNKQASEGRDKPEDAVIALPLWLYDHGGLTISIGSSSACQWDSGQVGWIYSTAEQARVFLGLQPDEEIQATHLGALEHAMKAVVAEYDDVLQGRVWGYRAYQLTVCEHCNSVTKEEQLDSCWGFIGDSAKDAMRDNMDTDLHPLLDEAWDNREC
jgi:hypothetical protein